MEIGTKAGRKMLMKLTWYCSWNVNFINNFYLRQLMQKILKAFLDAHQVK